MEGSPTASELPMQSSQVQFKVLPALGRGWSEKLVYHKMSLPMLLALGQPD